MRALPLAKLVGILPSVASCECLWDVYVQSALILRVAVCRQAKTENGGSWPMTLAAAFLTIIKQKREKRFGNAQMRL